MTDEEDLTSPALRLAASKLTSADIAEWNQQQRPAANWAKWKHCAKAELWQCVALSFGAEPIDATMRVVHEGFVIGARQKARPWFAEHSAMRERLEVALSNAGADAVSTLHPLPNQSGDMAAMLFSTVEFGDWARLTWPAGVPPEFPGRISTLPRPERSEAPTSRQARRLARFRELDGDMRKAGTGWQQSGVRGALAALAKEEAKDNRPMSDRTDVRADLIAALEEQRGS